MKNDSRLTNILPGETNALEQYVRSKSYRHSPNLNAMYSAEKRMQKIMEAPQLSSLEKSKLYSNQLNRLLMLKNKMNRKSIETFVQRAPSVFSNVSEPPSPVIPEPAEIDAPPVPATPKPHFLTPPATEEERPKLKRNFFHNWDPADWKESDLARMNSEAREEYERFLVRD